MASLTPLSKGLIALAVLGGMASAVWHLGLKERMANHDNTTAPSSISTSAESSPTPAPAVVTPVAPPPVPTPTATADSKAAAQRPTAENAELGRKLMDRGNYAQARAHLEAAVQGGDGPSACHLGEMTLKGQGGLAANQEQAAKLFQLAQSRGSICFASAQ